MRFVLLTFTLNDEGEELAEAITRDGLKLGLTPEQFWNLPVHHLAFCFFKSPEKNEALTGDAVAAIAEQNRGQVRPFVPSWFLAKARV